jgi:dephospho-CoA kinase
MLTVALTGGIATGKSIVGGVLLRRGCTLDKSDDVARSLLAPDQTAWFKIVERFGPGILTAGRAIDRKKLGALIFTDAEARRFVDGIVHPLVMAAKKKTIARLDREGRVRIFVSEAALTIEAGFAEYFDKVVVVYCPEEIQTERLMARDGLSSEEAGRRIRSQMPGGEKLGFADYVVDTSGTLDETVDQAEELFEELLLDWRIKSGSAG